MDLARRGFLAGMTGAAAGLAARSAAAGRVSAVIVTRPGRPDPDIRGVLEELGIACELVPPAGVAQVGPNRADLLWFVSATYPEPSELPEAGLERLDAFMAAGKGAFAEFVTNFPRLPAGTEMRKTGVARLFVNRPLPVPDALPEGTILEEHDSMYLPLSGTPGRSDAILNFARVAGVHKVLPGYRPQATWPGLLLGRRGAGTFAFATTSLSEFRRRQYAPAARWEDFLRQLVIALLPGAGRRQVLASYLPLEASTQPRAWAQPGESVKVYVRTRNGAQVRLAGPEPLALTPAGEGRFQAEWKPPPKGAAAADLRVSRAGRERTARLELRVEGREAAYRRALERNIRWFERSGVLLKPDGSAGVAEWISGPDIEGNRNAFGAEQMFSPERADCVFQSGLAFWLYGRAAGSARHQAIGHNMLRRILDFQRLEPGDAGYGLWNTRGRGGPAFQDDTSWATICALAGYRYTKDRSFRNRGLISARAQWKAFGPDDSLRVPQYARGGRAARLTARADEHPHNGGCVLSAWLYTYGITGDRQYLDTALPMLADMIAAFPKIRRYIISRTCESSRFLLPLSLACAYTRDERFRHALAEQAAYLRSRMAPCGAIQEEGSNIGDSVEGGDLGLTYDRDETIGDQLYCTGFAAMNFWIAYRATGDRMYLDDYFRVTDYLVRIQVDSPDPQIDGGWLRGFDYSLWEYYGANADTAWTAYSMETGWQNAVIDLALALYLTGDGFFEPRAAAEA